MSVYPKKSLQKGGADVVIRDVVATRDEIVAPPLQQPHIERAVVDHALKVKFDAEQAVAALDALGEKVNEILVALEAFGVTGSS